MTLQACMDYRYARRQGRPDPDLRHQVLGARVLHEVIDRAMQVHGALATPQIYPWRRCIGALGGAHLDGPDEVHGSPVAKQVLRGYTAPADRVPPNTCPPGTDAPGVVRVTAVMVDEFADLLARLPDFDLTDVAAFRRTIELARPPQPMATHPKS